MKSDGQKQAACCSPTAGRRAAVGGVAAPAGAGGPAHLAREAVAIPGGSGFIGTDRPELAIDGEAPLRRSRIKPFRIGATAVTNAEFAAFVEATGHVTEAERFGWSFVFWAQVPEGYPDTRGVAGAEWWRRVDGANWREINGPGTQAEAWKPDHPVVHVSWNDARAYAAWAGGRLPTEAEWEHAARGGGGDQRFPWGDAEPNDRDHFPCNIWQGRFPQENTGADGYLTTAPARSYAPNGYGLYNMVGNTWEWTAEAFTIRSLRKEVKARLAAMKGYRLMKGGSFLCHASYCYRYRIAARTGNAPDSTTTHQGFRVVWPA
ncbi:Serine/threonine-protein kinase pkn1 [Pseudoruegeria aquimaris]|uniref:Serine/threonine-protein kinase pkn1 n=1 Tax=Pseudoruegeria aquimaris TaxID=393663 RepID=A0A1Y5RV37_9RHOB|nr:formylglycine-generating enzyme family protein [Pseudoruegeria aquimaris]SLN25201.1 Serine/threonine-protein kinase pkn1 [Pseudoruegeria aquimaris]